MEDQDNIVTDAPETGGEPAEVVSAEATAEQSQVAAESAEPTASETQTESTLPDWAQKGWGKVNPFLAELTGKELDEVAKLSLSDRIALAQTTHSEMRDKLAELQAEGEFVGIKVDAPAEQWNPKEQLENLPAAFQNKLIDTVIQDHLPTFVEQSLQNPDAHPQEFQLLDRAAMLIAQQAFGRDPAEMKEIFDLTKGMTPAQVYAALSGTAQTVQPTNGNGQYGVAQGMPSSLAQQLLAEGYEPNSPVVQQAIARDAQFNQMQSQYSALQKQVNELSGYRTEQQQTTQQQAVQAAHKVIDGQAEAARKGALEAVTKGRVPENEMSEISELIGLKAEKLLASNMKAKNALELAKSWQADGVEGKAKGQLALYAAATEKAYRQAAQDILGRLVTQANGKRQADTTKAARKELGSSAASQTTQVKPTVSVTSDPGAYAQQLYEQSLPAR